MLFGACHMRKTRDSSLPAQGGVLYVIAKRASPVLRLPKRPRHMQGLVER